MFEQLYSLLVNRRTPRLVKPDDIPREDIEKILNSARSAPSFDKVFPYKIHALTNSADGKAKKEELIQFYRCGRGGKPVNSYKESFEHQEIVQPILSGLVLVYIITPQRSPFTIQTGPYRVAMQGTMDATISATYAMISALSLGYKAGMFCAVEGNTTENTEGVQLFSDNPNSFIAVSLTIATDVIDVQPPSSPNYKLYYNYKGSKSFVYPNKHRDIDKTPEIVVV